MQRKNHIKIYPTTASFYFKKCKVDKNRLILVKNLKIQVIGFMIMLTRSSGRFFNPMRYTGLKIRGYSMALLITKPNLFPQDFFIRKVYENDSWNLDAFQANIRIHTGKHFWNLIKSNWNQIVNTIFRLIWKQTETIRLLPNQSVNGKYNLISVNILPRYTDIWYIYIHMKITKDISHDV